MDRAIRDALRDAETACRARDVRVDASLEARGVLLNRDGLLYQAVYTIFRAIPDRLPHGGTLRVTTRMMAGGDVELAWEAAPTSPGGDSAAPDAIEALSSGPHGDLLELAVLALERYCRARLGAFQRDEGALRVLALIPSLERPPGSYSSGNPDPRPAGRAGR